MSYQLSRRGIVVSAAVVTFLGVVILILPEIVRRVALHQLQASFTVPVSIKDVDLDLFTGQAELKNLVLGTTAAPIARIPLISVRFSRRALLTGRIDVYELSFQRPRLIIERTNSGYTPIQAIRRSPSTKQSHRGVEFAIDRLEIHNGQVTFIDRSQDPDYKIRFTSLDIVAGPISSLPESRLEPTRFTAGVKIAGGILKISGSSKPLAEPLDLNLTVEANDVRLERFAVYLPYGTRLNLQNATIDGRGHYVLTHRHDTLVRHTFDGRLQLGRLALSTPKGTDKLVQLAGIEANQIHVDFAAHQAKIGSLSIDEPDLLIEHRPAGFNFHQFLPASVGTSKEETDSHQARFSLRIEKAETTGGTVEFNDSTVTPNVKTSFQNVSAMAKEITLWPKFAAQRIKAEAQTGKGVLRGTGSIAGLPLKGELTVTGHGIPFTPFQGYLNQLFTKARTSGGMVNGRVTLAFAPRKEENGETAARIRGQLEGHQMALQFPEDDHPFLRTRRLNVRLRTIRLGVHPLVDIGNIGFRGAHLSFVRHRDGAVNLSRLWSSDHGKMQDKNVPGESETSVAIRAISVQDSTVRVFDASVSPNYETELSQVNGKISDLLPATARAQLDFHGILSDEAEIQISGWFTPFTEKPHMSLNGSVQSYDLPPLNPYATEYVSHRIRRGQITTKISYTMEGNKMNATAELVLRHVRVGEKTGDEFVKRIGIPLDLALALLKDIRGVVRLQLAMSSARGTRVNIGALIWKAVTNAVIRAITVPFRLVGSILTLGGRIGAVHIDPVEFEPGTPELTAKSRKQLADLAELLKRKPQLDLRLHGQASRNERNAIQKRILSEKIKATGKKSAQQALVELYHHVTGIRLTTPLSPRVEGSVRDFLQEHMKVSEEQLHRLADNRAAFVKQQLEKKGLAGRRLLVGSREIVDQGSPAVEFKPIS